jgi:hypothetical protein
LIGAKLLLNFNAISLPDISFYLLVAVVGLIIIALIKDNKSKKELSANAEVKINSANIPASVHTVNS